MQDYTSKQLYIANGGNKVYIGKDGFADIYKATPEEEAEWAQEVIAKAVWEIETSANSTVVEFAIDNLLFHRYQKLEQLLADQLKHAGPATQIVLSAALLKMNLSEQLSDIVYKNLQRAEPARLQKLFAGLGNLKDSRAAGRFLISCIEGNNEWMALKAHTTLISWSVGGFIALRKNDLLDMLYPANKPDPVFFNAVARLRQILMV